MYAIVEIAGQQFKVEKDQKVFVHRLNEERGAQVEFDKVLLIDADGINDRRRVASGLFISRAAADAGSGQCHDKEGNDREGSNVLLLRFSRGHGAARRV